MSRRAKYPDNISVDHFLGIAGVIFLGLDSRGRVTLINRKGLEILGLDDEEQALEANWFDSFVPESMREETKEVFRKLMRGEVELLEYYTNPVVSKKGEERIIAWHNKVLKDESGRITGTLSSGEDITEKTLVERELVESENFLQKVFNAMQDGISILDRSLNVVRTNVWMEKTYSEKMPLVGKKCYTAYQNRETPCPWCPSVKTFETGKADTTVAPYPSEEKQSGWIELITFPLRDKSGKIANVIEYVRDISDRVRAEESLRESEARIRSIFRAAPVGIGIVVNRVLKEVNDRICEMTGYSQEELIGNDARMLYPSDTDYEFVGREKYGQIRKHGTGTVETKWKRKNGGIIDVLLSSTPIETDNPESEVTFTALDITERKKAERRTMIAAEMGSDLIYEWELESDTLKWFGKMEEALGYPPDGIPYTISRWLDLAHPDDTERLRGSAEKHRSSNQPIFEEYRIRHSDGSWRYWLDRAAPLVDAEGRPYKWIGVCVDFTRRKQVEEQLRQAQKMEAVGQLAGGIAHDFNNLLQVINGNIELALSEVQETHPARESLDDVARAGKMAAGLVRQLLAFSRRQVMKPEWLDMNRVISELFKMLRRIIGENIDIEFVAGKDLDRIQADRGMVEQILMNLCVNSRDAMPNGGKLSIETENVLIAGDFCARHPWAEPGRYVLIRIADSGHGMDRSTLERIFEPFFSTKEKNKGTGLGLSTAYGIIKQHNGMIHVYSEPEKGSVFKAYIPAGEGEAETAETKESDEMAGGGETILLAEDDDMVRNLTAGILERAGYSVIGARDGEEALAQFEKNADKIDLLILDVVMPRLGGRRAYERMRKARKDVPVIFSSGYSEKGVHTGFVLDEGLELLQKPFGAADLLQMVRSVLNSGKN